MKQLNDLAWRTVGGLPYVPQVTQDIILRVKKFCLV